MFKVNFEKTSAMNELLSFLKWIILWAEETYIENDDSSFCADGYIDSFEAL